MGDPFRTLLADPPWPAKDKLPGKGRGAVKHYRTMPIAQIKAFTLPPLAADSWLFLWRVSWMQSEALEVMSAWGFTPKSEIVWVKVCEREEEKLARSVLRGVAAGKPVPACYSEAVAKAVLAGPKLRVGMGRYVRLVHETMLIGARGKALRTRLSKSIPSVIFAPRGRHSAKPEQSYRLIEQLAPGPRVELFARDFREGWTCHGLEVGSAP